MHWHYKLETTHCTIDTPCTAARQGRVLGPVLTFVTTVRDWIPGTEGGGAGRDTQAEVGRPSLSTLSASLSLTTLIVPMQTFWYLSLSHTLITSRDMANGTNGFISNLKPFYQLWWWFPRLLLLRNLHLLKDNWRNNFWGILLILSILQILAFLGSKDVSVILEQKVLTSSMDNVIYPEAALPHREAGNRETLGQEMRGWQLTESHIYAVLKAKKCCCGGGSPHKYPTPPLLPHYSSQPGWIQDSDDFRFVWVWPSSTSQTC